MKSSWLFFFLIFAMSSCVVVQNPYPSVAPGVWRGVLKLEANPIASNKQADPLPGAEDTEFEEVTEGELPFLFEVIYDSDSTFYMEFINGEERIRVDEISIARDNSTLKDSIRIDFPVYGSYIQALFEEDVMEGVWVDPNRGEYAIPFVAYHGKDYRFTLLRKPPLIDLSGKWKAVFSTDTEDSYPALGVFEQSENHLTGTFQTETGDYRFLEGTVQDNKFYLSCFDGAHAFLFEGKIMEDERLIGSFRSGNHYRTTWEASRDPDFALASPDSLTYLNEPGKAFEFSFPNPDGETISLDDPAFAGKIKIVQILGTWCPNCRDETAFLVEYLEKNPSDKLAVIGLAFEKFQEKESAAARIRQYKNSMEVPYEILHAGYYNKKSAGEQLPMLNKIVSYPTLVFLDANNQVRRIHTGFNGPATSDYETFKKDFHQFLQGLLQEI